MKVQVVLGIRTVMDLHTVHAGSKPPEPLTATCCRACTRLFHAEGHVRHPGLTRRWMATAQCWRCRDTAVYHPG